MPNGQNELQQLNPQRNIDLNLQIMSLMPFLIGIRWMLLS